MKEVLVSIIVPVYQAEIFLQKSIETILNQTLTNIEIILVDDGSKDNSGIICDNLSLRDARVKVIHKKNGGQSSARNTGIDAAKGKYIGFMDNDDFLYPDMCQRLYDNAERYNAEVSAGSFITQNEVGVISHDKQTHKIYNYDNKKGIEAYLSREIMDIYVWTKLYRKDFLDNHHLRFEEGHSDEDFLFNHSVFMIAQNTIMDDTPIYLYIERVNSTCRTFYKKNLQKYLADTYYRLTKIEKEVGIKYPDLLYLAQRQTIIACFRMLFVISMNKKSECEPYYS